MCGITGIHSLNGAPIDPTAIERMTAAVGHRGPDGHGCHVVGPVGLGHARLSIIDVEGGAQPMSTEDGALWITFNGEIFNYVELKQELIRRGHRFRTNSDTEVILHAYLEKGEDCVADFNGQWAFAIWDSRRRTLFLSRDRLGVRPLYYTVINEQVVFGSEVKALFANPEIPREIDLRALDQIFTFWAPLPPRTIFRGISEVPPGHSLTISDSGLRLYRYWQPDFTPRHADEADCVEELLHLLVDATRIRLRADVPVGAYLSGGLDSTAVTTIVRQLTNRAPRTFSVAFNEAEFDESAHQMEAVRHVGAEHAQISCATSDIADVFPNVIWHAERPILRTAPAPLYLLAKAVRNAGYKVVMTGEGSDEMFGGYDIFKEAKVRAFWAAQPLSSRRPLLLKRLYPYLSNVQSQSDAYLQAFFRIDPGPSNCFFSHLPRWQLTARLKALFSADVRSALQSYDGYEDLKSTLPEGFERWSVLARAQYLEASALLPGYILSSQGDRVAMAHGVEGRFPFLDHRVVEFASSLPPQLKLKVLNEKYILKRAVSHLVPPSILRRPKQPYRAPEAASFVMPAARGKSPEYVNELLDENRLLGYGIFNPAAVRPLIAKARSGNMLGIKDNMGLVGVLSTQLLIHRFIKSLL